MGADPKTYGGDLLNFGYSNSSTDGYCFELARHFRTSPHSSEGKFLPLQDAHPTSLLCEEGSRYPRAQTIPQWRPTQRAETRCCALDLDGENGPILLIDSVYYVKPMFSP